LREVLEEMGLSLDGRGEAAAEELRAGRVVEGLEVRKGYTCSHCDRVFGTGETARRHTHSHRDAVLCEVEVQSTHNRGRQVEWFRVRVPLAQGGEGDNTTHVVDTASVLSVQDVLEPDLSQHPPTLLP
jgi:hypothetical protein